MVPVIVVAVIVGVVVAIAERPEEVLEGPVGYVLALRPPQHVRGTEVDAFVDAASVSWSLVSGATRRGRCRR